MIISSLFPKWLSISYASILVSAGVWIPLLAIILKKINPNIKEDNVMGACFCIVCLPFFVVLFILLSPLILLAFIFDKGKKRIFKSKIDKEKLNEKNSLSEQYIEKNDVMNKIENSPFSVIKMLLALSAIVFIFIFIAICQNSKSGHSVSRTEKQKVQNYYSTRRSPYKAVRREYFSSPFPTKYSDDIHDIDNLIKRFVKQSQKDWYKQQEKNAITIPTEESYYDSVNVVSSHSFNSDSYESFSDKIKPMFRQWDLEDEKNTIQMQKDLNLMIEANSAFLQSILETGKQLETDRSIQEIKMDIDEIKRKLNGF